MTDDLPSRGTCNIPSFPTISDYDGLEQNIHGHNTLETNVYHKSTEAATEWAVTKGVLRNFAKIHRKASVPESLY